MWHTLWLVLSVELQDTPRPVENASLKRSVAAPRPPFHSPRQILRGRRFESETESNATGAPVPASCARRAVTTSSLSMPSAQC